MELTDSVKINDLPVVAKRKVNRSDSEKTFGGSVTSELLPFRSTMNYQLSKRGYNTRNLSFKELIPLYFNEFVSNKENKNSSYQPINCYEFRNNTSFKIQMKIRLLNRFETGFTIFVLIGIIKRVESERI